MKRKITLKRPSSSRKINIGLYQATAKPSRIWASRSLADTRRLAARVARQELPNVWLLSGTLGSGKTTFVRAVARALGFAGSVTSPTFVLRHDLPLNHARWRRIVHIDAYRLRGQHEEAALELDAAANDPKCLLLIEWPQKISWRPNRPTLRIAFSHARTGRRVSFSRAI